jgi:hypothetical protein
MAYKFKKVSLKQALKMGPEKFVENHLFPFMRQENCQGFAMDFWNLRTVPRADVDNIPLRKFPRCGFHCIGGSMETILGLPTESYNMNILGRVLGLYDSKARHLFFGWKNHGGWPVEFVNAYKTATTRKAKEKIAEKIILLSIQTKGECLDNANTTES